MKKKMNPGKKSSSNGAKQNGGVTGYAPTHGVTYPVTAKSPESSVRKPSAVHSDFHGATVKS